MSRSPEHHIPNGIRAIGESTRPEAFIEARNKLVDSINDWLRHQAELRQASGTASNQLPLITEVNFGPTSENTHMIAEERRVGQVLMGNPENLEPLVFQKVTRLDSGILEVIQVQGTDPHFTMMYGDNYQPSLQTETVAAFSMREIDPSGTEQAYRFAVHGNGSVHQQNTEHGTQVHVSKSLYGVDEVLMAQVAFDSMTQTLAEQGA